MQQHGNWDFSNENRFGGIWGDYFYYFYRPKISSKSNHYSGQMQHFSPDKFSFFTTKIQLPIAGLRIKYFFDDFFFRKLLFRLFLSTN
jgi:hypothetical protein